MCTAERSSGFCEESCQCSLTCFSPCCRPVYHLQGLVACGVAGPNRSTLHTAWSTTGEGGVRPCGLRTAA